VKGAQGTARPASFWNRRSAVIKVAGLALFQDRIDMATDLRKALIGSTAHLGEAASTQD
jgi:hypothetical protein